MRSRIRCCSISVVGAELDLERGNYLYEGDHDNVCEIIRAGKHSL